MGSKTYFKIFTIPYILLLIFYFIQIVKMDEKNIFKIVSWIFPLSNNGLPVSALCTSVQIQAQN